MLGLAALGKGGRIRVRGILRVGLSAGLGEDTNVPSQSECCGLSFLSRYFLSRYISLMSLFLFSLGLELLEMDLDGERKELGIHLELRAEAILFSLPR